MLGTGERLCPGLAEGTQMGRISLQKSQLRPGSQKVKKWQFTLIASSQEKEQSKSLWGKRGWSLCPPCSIGRETLWRKHLWDPRSMSTVSCNIHSEHSREKYLLWCLLDLLTYNSPLPPLWPQWPPHGSWGTTALLPQSSASCSLCLKHSRCLCDTVSHFPQVPTQISPSQGPSRMTITQIPYASSHPLYPYPALFFFLALSPPDISDICLISVSPH